MKLGIAAKLALLLAAVGVLAAGLTGFYAYQASRELLVASAKDRLLTSTQVLARRLSLNREEMSRNLQVLSGQPAALAVLKRADAASADQLATLFAGMMKANPAYSQLRLISASEHGLERVRVDRVDLRPQRIEGDALQEKAHFAYVAQTLKLAAGSTYLSRITLNHESGGAAGLGQPALQLAMPVVDGNGPALGIVVVNVDLNGMFALLAADLPSSFTLYLANGAGDILVHPDSSRTFGFDKGRRVLVQDEFPPTREVVDGTLEHTVFEARASGDGGPVVAAFISRVIDVPSEESRMVLGLAQPLTDVLEQSQRLGADVLRIVLGLCLVCLMLAVLLARAVTRPIDAVSAAAKRFAVGQPAGPLPLHRRDEIGTLARSFQQMQGQIAQQLADLQTKQDELVHLAQHDVLTGLPNRRLFQERLATALAHAQRYGEEVGVLFIDLDDFKAINDEAGHDAGDAVLRTVAERLSTMVREVDTVARLGGDEFVLLLAAPTPHKHLAAIAEKLLAGLKVPIAVHGQDRVLHASIGISRYPQDGQTASTIMAAADQAMYQAKAARRAGYHFFSVTGF